ncbi:MAG: hypothetical protein R6U22_08750 [Desulfohalobiaceae bacterium]
MSRKKISLILLFVALLLGSFSGWYLFQQSSKLSQLDSESQPQETEGQALEQAEPLPAGSEPEFVQKLRKGMPDPEKALLGQTGPQASDRQEQEESWWTWIQDYVLTNYFIQDLAEYTVAHYVPPQSKDNAGEQGKSRLSFKSLNARYGLELTGFRYQEEDPQEARKEILDRVMDSQVLERIYEKYAQEFLEQFLQEARQRKWEFEGPNGQMQERTLNQEEIADLLQTKGSYMQAVAGVFQALAQNQESAALVQEYLEHEQDAVHSNYILNQEQNRLKMLQRQVQEEEGEDPELEQELAQTELRKEQAVRDYRRAIQARERAREDLIKAIKSRSSSRELESHEILYIAEWVQRRLVQGQNRDAVAKVAQLLQDLGQRFSDKARELRE